MVMSMASYLEVYLRAVIELALQADPMVRFGSPGLQDGVTWLKRGIGPADTAEYVESCCKGMWSSRLKAYSRLFGPPPVGLSSELDVLEDMRKVRNAVGHEFGRRLDKNHFENHFGTRIRVKEMLITRWLASVETAVKSIDQHLLVNHVGEFEALKFYHFWRSTPRIGKAHSLSEPRALQQSLRQLNGNPPSQRYCSELIAFYNNA